MSASLFGSYAIKSYICNSSDYGAGISVKALKFVDECADFVEVRPALIQQFLPLVSLRGWALHGGFAKQSLYGTRWDESMKRTGVEEILPDIGERVVIASHDIIEPLRE